MYTFDEIVKRYKKQLKELVTEFKEQINNNDFKVIYAKLDSDNAAIIIPAFTALLFKNNINPLKYMNNVPYYFADHLNIKELEIPDNVTRICSSAFSGCSSLTSIKIPNNVKIIESNAFRGCASLTNIEIPESVTIIESCAFISCSSLTSIKIPESVTSIGDYAFAGCTKLKDVYYTGSKEAWKNIEIKSYNDGLRIATIHYNS